MAAARRVVLLADHSKIGTDYFASFGSVADVDVLVTDSNVDRELIEVGNKALAAGRVDSLSGWVNLALTEQAAKERRLQALAEAVAAYESEFGAISPAELAAQQRADRKAAVIVRGAPAGVRPRRRRRAA